MRTAIYVRVSTDGQEREGTSLESQEASCRAFARDAGWQVVACLSDTASGATLDRPGMEGLRRLLRQGAIDVVLAHAVDRLSRNQNQMGVLFDEIEQAGARLECVSEQFEDTPEGRFILAARAFIAEVERAKIRERTARGKEMRARSGKLPQATGKGMYGYRYNRETGRREIDPFQAAVVERIFNRYAEARSFSAVARDLNDNGVPAFEGGCWYPITVRSVLTNETYTGRSVYRRTKRIRTRVAGSEKRRSRVVTQPESEWIEVEGATPRIIDQDVWDRVQAIIDDPERLRRRPQGRTYALSTRVRCAMCGGAMVGQTLTVKGRPFRYYRCRHAYTSNTSYQCAARYVRADNLEAAVWDAVRTTLGRVSVVINEWRHHSEPRGDVAERVRLEEEIAALREREARLVRLFSLGDVDEAVVREQMTDVRRQRALLEERVRGLAPVATHGPGEVDQEFIARICRKVLEWLDGADEERRVMCLEALQVAVQATKGEGTLRGVLPAAPPSFITDDESCRCSSSGSRDEGTRLAPVLPDAGDAWHRQRGAGDASRCRTGMH